MAEPRDYGHIISPTFARHALDTNKTEESSFRYTNAFFDGSDSQEFETLVGFIYQNEGTPIVSVKAPAKYSNYDMSSWVKVKNNTFILKKGETKIIDYEITTPSDPRPGGKYAVIIVAKKEDVQALKASGSEMKETIGFPLIGYIKGTEIKKSDVVSFTADKKVYLWWPFQPIKYTTRVSNSGNVDYLPGGNIFVFNKTITEPVWQATINEADLIVLPDDSRSFNNQWESSTRLITSKDGGLFVNTEFFRFGKYTSAAKIGYDVGTQRLVADRVVQFYIIPMPLILTILALWGVSVIVKKLRNIKRKK